MCTLRHIRYRHAVPGFYFNQLSTRIRYQMQMKYKWIPLSEQLKIFKLASRALLTHCQYRLQGAG